MSETKRCTVVIYSFKRGSDQGTGRIVIYQPQQICSVQQLLEVENWIKTEQGYDNVFAMNLIPLEDLADTQPKDTP